MTVKDAVQRDFSHDYEPVSVLTFHGRLQQLDYRGYRLLLDLEGRIKWIEPLRAGLWPGPSSALRRTMGNRWLLYDSGAYQDVFELTGRYYFPIPFGQEGAAFGTADSGKLRKVLALVDEAAVRFGFPDSAELGFQAAKLRSILKATVPVLPPDTICIDYDILPLMLTRGCVHNCRFCAVKTSAEIETVGQEEFRAQVDGLTKWTGRDLNNYQGLFIGQNDALAAGQRCLMQAAEHACGSLPCDRLFLFGSVASFMERAGLDQPPSSALEALARLPFKEVVVNIGLESFHQGALDYLGKPVKAADVRQAFRQGLELAAKHDRLKISFNFVLSKALSRDHMDLISQELAGAPKGSGCRVYLSPLLSESWRPGQLKRMLFRLKGLSRLPVFAYFLVPYL